MWERRGWRARIGWRLRCWADRIDPGGAFRALTADRRTFTFEDGRGLVFRGDGQGCPLWYLAHDYELAHEESDTNRTLRERDAHMAILATRLAAMPGRTAQDAAQTLRGMFGGVREEVE